MIVNVLCCKGTVNAACTQTSNYSVCVCVYSANRQDGGHRYWIVCVCVSR